MQLSQQEAPNFSGIARTLQHQGMLSLEAPKQVVLQRMLCLSHGALVCLADHAINVLTCLWDQRMGLIADYL